MKKLSYRVSKILVCYQYYRKFYLGLVFGTTVLIESLFCAVCIHMESHCPCSSFSPAFLLINAVSVSTLQ